MWESPCPDMSGSFGHDGQCDLYGPGHEIHWIHFNHSMREPAVVIPVTASVDDDGLCTSRAMTSLWCGGITARRCYALRCNASAGGRCGSRAGTSLRSRRSLHGECAKRVQLGGAGPTARMPRCSRYEP